MSSLDSRFTNFYRWITYLPPAMSEFQIAAIGAVAIAIIGSVFTGIVSVIVALRTNKKVEEVHTLVNGSATTTLREISDLKARIATLTGRSADASAADSAKTNLEEKLIAMSVVSK